MSRTNRDTYIAYGLRIRSIVPLPELIAREAPADVLLRLGKVGTLPACQTGSGISLCGTRVWAYLFQPSVGASLVRSGREIVLDPAPAVSERELRQFILGPILAVLLQQRGFLVLHASGVAVSDGAAIFLGHSGSGKSTLAAALHARGYGLVADDVVAVDLDPQHPMPRVAPGFPQLKLWPELHAAGHRPLSSADKILSRADRGFPGKPLALRSIYVLAEGSGPRLEALTAREAFLELLRHSYPASALSAQASGKGDVHFRQCVDLVHCITPYRLTSQRRYGGVPELVGFVDANLTGDRAEAHQTADGPSATNNTREVPRFSQFPAVRVVLMPAHSLP